LPAPNEGRGCSDGDEGLGDAGELLVVPDEASALHGPSEGALDDPAPADDDEALHPRHTADDLERDVGLVLRPGDEFPGVATVGEDTLDEGKPLPGSPQDALCPVTILDVGAVDLDGEQPAIRVGQDMPLSAVDALSGVIAFGSPF
jgi:hypothetical protein